MVYLLAVVFPPLAFLIIGKPFQAILSFLLQISCIGWLPAAIWAICVVNNHHAEQRNLELIAALNKPALKGHAASRPAPPVFSSPEGFTRLPRGAGGVEIRWTRRQLIYACSTVGLILLGFVGTAIVYSLWSSIKPALLLAIRWAGYLMTAFGALVLLLAPMGLAAAYLAKAKGRSIWHGYLWGQLAGPFGVIATALQSGASTELKGGAGPETAPEGDDLIRVHCSCGKRFVARPEHSGRRGRCTACGAPLIIPTATVSKPVQVDEFDSSQRHLQRLAEMSLVDMIAVGLAVGILIVSPFFVRIVWHAWPAAPSSHLARAQDGMPNSNIVEPQLLPKPAIVVPKPSIAKQSHRAAWQARNRSKTTAKSSAPMKPMPPVEHAITAAPKPEKPKTDSARNDTDHFGSRNLSDSNKPKSDWAADVAAILRDIPLEKRKEIWREFCLTDFRANHEADLRFPDQEQFLERSDYFSKVIRRYDAEVRNRYRITQLHADAISFQAVNEKWSDPPNPYRNRRRRAFP